MKRLSENNKREVSKEPHLTLKSSLAKMKKGEKLAEHHSKNSKNEVFKKPYLKFKSSLAKQKKGEKFAMKRLSENNKSEVSKEPHLTLKSSLAKMKKGEKLAEHHSINSKNEVVKPYLKLKSSLAKQIKGEKFAMEGCSKNIKNEVPKEQKVGSTIGEPLTEKLKKEEPMKQYGWRKIGSACIRKEIVIDGHLLHPYCKLRLVPKKKALQVNIDNDVATDMDPCADEISGNKNGMA